MDAKAYQGTTFGIATTASNSDVTSVTAAALSYTTIGKVGSFGARGRSTNVLTYDTITETVTQKAKGMTNAGDPEMEVARDESDAGQDLLRAYGAPGDTNAYVLKETRPDGTIYYRRGIVTGPTQPGGRNEDFDLEVFTFGMVQDAIKV